MLRYNGTNKTLATAAQCTRGSSLLTWCHSALPRITKSDCKVDTSCQQSTHSQGGKTPNKAKPPMPPDQTHHPDGYRSDSLPVRFPPTLERSELMKDGQRPSFLQRPRWWVSSGCWTDRAYLSTALCAWADPACRSFCHSHNFFSLSRRERREGNVSVEPKEKHKTGFKRQLG